MGDVYYLARDCSFVYTGSKFGDERLQLFGVKKADIDILKLQLKQNLEVFWG